MTENLSRRSRARQARVGELSVHQERDLTTVSQLLPQIQDLQIKANSLSDPRSFHDPETASSSGASHVPGRTSVPSPRTMPCRDSGLPHDARNIMGTPRNFFESLLARGPPSALFENARNLASSSPGLRPDITGNTTVPERDETKAAEFVDTCTTLPQRCWTSQLHWCNLISQWYGGLPDISPLGNASWKIPDSMDYQRWKVNFETGVCSKNSRSSSHNALDQRS